METQSYRVNCTKVISVPVGESAREMKSHSLCTSTLSPAGGSQTSTDPERTERYYREDEFTQ